MPSLDTIKAALVAALILYATVITYFYKSVTEDFAEFKAGIVVLGQEAEKHAKEVNDRHEKTLKENKDAWNKALPSIRENAIDSYMRRFPRGLLGDSCPGQVPGPSGNPGAPDGAVEERMAPGEMEFISNCAEDAGKLRSLRSWATDNKLKVK